MRTMTAVLVVLFCTAIGVWTYSARNVTAMNVTAGNGPIPSKTPVEGNPNPAPKYKTVNLSCSTGVIYTKVTNNSGKAIPAAAKITVQGVQADCSQTANGPLAKGASIQLLGCQEKVTTCKAYARWPLAEP